MAPLSPNRAPIPTKGDGGINFSNLRINQPESQSTIVFATFDDAGNPHERVLRLVEIDGNAYVAANHWPHAWYHQVLEYPNVEVEMEDTFEP